jgi:phosphohistidine phosphatase
MILYIVRHAWAVEQEDSGSDAQRPLTEEGFQRFAGMIRMLAERGFAPQLIATSPLVRCRQTADLIAQHVPGKPAVVEREDLAPGSDLEGLLRWTNRQSGRGEQIAWVGHAPDVTHLAAALVGDRRGAIRFSKGGVASIHFDGPVEVDAGELWWLLTARVLGC